MGDINAKDITAWNITAVHITAGDITAKHITAWNINAGDITAGDINAWNITAGDIVFYGVCYAYKDFVCSSIMGRRKNNKYFCLDNEVKIRK